ncbi:hypothetical protein J4208_02555 [Candidatus Woesearchaeota archaeon]|nr:hypothetical protein [Candidatus Woesearchaeota archaeon]
MKKSTSIAIHVVTAGAVMTSLATFYNRSGIPQNTARTVENYLQGLSMPKDAIDDALGMTCVYLGESGIIPKQLGRGLGLLAVYGNNFMRTFGADSNPTYGLAKLVAECTAEAIPLAFAAVCGIAAKYMLGIGRQQPAPAAGQPPTPATPAATPPGPTPAGTVPGHP